VPSLRRRILSRILDSACQAGFSEAEKVAPAMHTSRSKSSSASINGTEFSQGRICFCAKANRNPKGCEDGEFSVRFDFGPMWKDITQGGYQRAEINSLWIGRLITWAWISASFLWLLSFGRAKKVANTSCSEVNSSGKCFWDNSHKPPQLMLSFSPRRDCTSELGRIFMLDVKCRIRRNSRMRTST
jgi:hypothetical protein